MKSTKWQLPRCWWAGCIATVALSVFTSRLWLIHAWGSALPYWDQWDAEALGLYRPWLLGTFEWPQLFAPHNEHRIALTRLADLALFVWHGEWRPQDQLILNASLHAAIAAAVAGVFMSWMQSRGTRTAWLAFVTLLFALPAGWQNALWGFQSQVYFANLLAFAAITGLALSSPGHCAWWLALVAGVLATFGNAGGLLALPAAAIGLVVAMVIGFKISPKTEKTEPMVDRTEPQATSDTVPVSRTSPLPAADQTENGHIRLRRHDSAQLPPTGRTTRSNCAANTEHRTPNVQLRRTDWTPVALLSLLRLLRPFVPVVVVIIAAAAVSLLRVDVPGHAYLKAKSMAQFLRVFGHTLA